MLRAPETVQELHRLISEPTNAAIHAVAESPGNFLVLGAGGKMGFHLCLMLRRCLEQLGRKDDVIAVSRWSDVEIRRNFEERGLRTLSCDLSDPSDLALLPDADQVFFLAGVKFGTADAPDLLHRINVDTPEQVAARYVNQRIVALSSGCVYSFVPPSSGGAKEGDDTDPPGDYAQSCKGREQAFIRSGGRSSLIRLNYSVDLQYGVLVDIAESVLKGRPIDLSTGYANAIWQGDATAYIISSISQATHPPFILNVTGERILKLRDVALRFGELLDREVNFTGTEASTAWLNDASKCHEMFGKPRVTEDQLIQWVARWLKNGGKTLGKPTYFENRKGVY